MSPDHKLEIGQEAEAEIQEAFAWYFERSRQAARNFLAEVDRAFEVIQSNPGVWPVFLEPSGSSSAGARRFVLRKFPYSVIYHLSPDTITVVALAHHKRWPRYWEQR